MNPGAPKENENPTIIETNKERSHARRTPFGWSQMGDFKKAEDGSDNWLPTTSEDRAILRALVDVSKATNGRGVALLNNVGLSIPSSTDDALRYPLFQASEEETKSDAPLTRGVSRDKIDAEEVFDIIRNIQDPEHPNTLEELGVVSVGQVEVTDEDSGNAGEPCTRSFVKVRFT